MALRAPGPGEARAHRRRHGVRHEIVDLRDRLIYTGSRSTSRPCGPCGKSSFGNSCGRHDQRQAQPGAPRRHRIPRPGAANHYGHLDPSLRAVNTLDAVAALKSHELDLRGRRRRPEGGLRLPARSDRRAAAHRPRPRPGLDGPAGRIGRIRAFWPAAWVTGPTCRGSKTTSNGIRKRLRQLGRLMDR